MLSREVLEIYDCLDQPGMVGSHVAKLFPEDQVEVERLKGVRGETDFIRVSIAGTNGKRSGGTARTLGVIGRLGGLGVRPAKVGFVSDGDGALIVIAVALKLSRMYSKGDSLDGDVIVATHMCTAVPILPRQPVDFVDSPVELSEMNDFEVSKEMDAILTIDTSRGNKLVNRNGYAITPTVKEGWILKVSDDLLKVMEITSQQPPSVFPITMQDITAFGNDVYHFNSLLQPSIATNAPLVGIALTSAVQVPGCATGVHSLNLIEEVGRFIVECAQEYGSGNLEFYSTEEFSLLKRLYGDMSVLQTIPDL